MDCLEEFSVVENIFFIELMLELCMNQIVVCDVNFYFERKKLEFDVIILEYIEEFFYML